MQSKITQPLLLTFLTLGFWSVSFFMSHYLAAKGIEEQQSARTGQTAAIPAQLESLQNQAKEHPQDLPLQLQLAHAFYDEAAKTSNVDLVMKSVNTFNAVLAVEPKNSDALLSLATICAQQGVLDKAVSYYMRYLEDHPDDHLVQSDYALALLQNGQSVQAITMLKTLTAKKPSFYPARLALAVAYRETGKMKEAAAEAKSALPLAPDKQTKEQIEQFLAQLSNPSPPRTPTEQAQIISPAQTIQEYFSAHPIIGPKIVRTTWPAPSKVQIEVNNFPVAEMPEFAKAKFLGDVQQKLAIIPEEITIIFVDAKTKADLLSIKVGKAN